MGTFNPWSEMRNPHYGSGVKTFILASSLKVMDSLLEMVFKLSRIGLAKLKI